MVASVEEIFVSYKIFSFISFARQDACVAKEETITYVKTRVFCSFAAIYIYLTTNSIKGTLFSPVSMVKYWKKLLRESPSLGILKTQSVSDQPVLNGPLLEVV